MVPNLASIIIVAHNSWPDLALAIQSSLNQSYTPVEVIVVDNASVDETARVVPARFGDAVRYLRQPQNRYDGGGYNAGLRAAAGEYVQFLDADDFLAPDKIEQQVRVFRDNPDADIVRGAYRRFRRGPGPARWEESELPHPEDFLAALIKGDGSGAGMLIHNLLFRRRALDRVGEWDENIVGVDLDYFLRSVWLGCRFVDSPEALCFYQVRDGQMSAIRDTQRHNREKTWTKALTYITSEPHRTLVAQRLAQLRFVEAISSRTLTHHERLQKLRAAADCHPDGLSRAAFAIGWLLIHLPGSRALAETRALHTARGLIAQRLALK